MRLIRKLSLKTAGYINIAAISASVIVHLLLIFQTIPYTYLNGGRSPTLTAARQTSIISIIILFLMILINLWAVLFKEKFTSLLKALLWLLFVYSVFGTIQQFLGTTFEKVGMSILCIINVIMYFRLAIEKRS
jgi:putative effector of murein hydrolase LrgA (UPF0299 family)